LKNNREYIKFLFIGFCCILAFYFLSFVVPARLSYGINDFSTWYAYSLFRKPQVKPIKIIGVAVDDDSLNKIPSRWPWKRSIYAQIIKILDKEKVNTIGIDFAFVGEAEDRQDDAFFAETLKNTSSKVVLAYFFDYKNARAVLPLPEFRDAAYSVGMLNTPADADNKIRRLRGYLETEGNFYYSFSLQLASAYLNRPAQEIAEGLPLLKDRTFFIKFSLKPKDITTINFYDILENLEKLKKALKDYGLL